MSAIVELITDPVEAGTFPICNNCKHHKGGLECDAFGLIPDVILMGDNDHSKPLPGQGNKIVFEKITKPIAQ